MERVAMEMKTKGSICLKKKGKKVDHPSPNWLFMNAYTPLIVIRQTNVISNSRYCRLFLFCKLCCTLEWTI